MGFDIYGLDPNYKTKRPEIDWDKATDEEKDIYFKKIDEFQEHNPGYYFRNNVWWWRPLAELIHDKCGDLLSEKQKKGLHNNSGTEFDDNTALAIARRLSDLRLRPGENLVPRDYPFPYNKHFEEIYSTKSWDDSYPFNRENVEEFINFARHSGGFAIC